MVTIAPQGSALMKVTPQGVQLIQGSNPSRTKWTTVLPLSFSHADHTWQVTSVHSPDVIEGTVFYVILCKSTEYFAAFTMMYNTILEHSVIVANTNGLPSSTGPIELIQDAGVVKYDSILYDETQARLIFEVTSNAPHCAPMGFHDFCDGPVTPTAVCGASSKTDIMYAYTKSGDVAVIYADYDQATGFSQIYDPNGNLGPIVEGAPESQFGLKSPNCDAGDDFDIIFMILTSGVVAQKIATAVPGDIQTIWTTTTDEACTSKLSVLSVVGGSEQVTTFEVTEANPAVYVYMPSERKMFDVVTGAELESVPEPDFPPHSGVAIDGGHITVATDLSDPLEPLRVYTVYNEDGVISGTAAAALNANNAYPNPASKLVRNPYGFAYGSTHVTPNLTAMIDAGAQIGWTQIFTEYHGYSWNIPNGEIRADRYPVSDLSNDYPDITYPYPGDARITHVIPQDDDNTLLIFQKAPDSLSGAPQFSMSVLYIDPEAADPTTAKMLLPETTIQPNVADLYTFGGETFLVMSGNPLTNDQAVISILKCDNWETASPTLTTYKEFPIPANQAVESLRAEGSAMVCTFEPNEIGTVYTSFAYTAGNLANYHQNPAMDSIWTPVGMQSIPISGDLVCQGILCRKIYGQIATYVILENSGLSVLSVTVGSTSVDIPAGEIRIVHLQNVAENFLTYGVSQVEAAPALVDAVVSAVSLVGPGIPPSSTVASVFFPGTVSTHVTGRYLSQYALFGRNTQPVATLFMHDHATDSLQQVSLTETVNAIAVKIPKPAMVVSGATFI